MNPSEDKIYLAEFYRRKANVKKLNPLRLRSPEFHKQNEVLNARDMRFKAVNCTRRSGKSIGEAIDHIEICEKYPGSRCLYLGITTDSVTEIIWDVFKDLIEEGGYKATLNETKKIIRFSNGSRIRLAGLDVSEKQMRKILGQKLRKVTIDEAGSITQDMKKICYQMIMPALSDLRPHSWLTICGTCENIPNTFFEDVTEGRERAVNWRVFKWTAYDNPYMAKQWAEEIAEMTAANPLIHEASWFKTHYLNIWCSDDDLLIIPFNTKGHYAPELPEQKEWQYVLGVDLGFNDASAFAVVAYSPGTPICYCVETYKETELDLSGVAKQVRNIQRRYDIGKIIVDGANKQGVEEIKNRHQIPMTAAEKSDKATYLMLLRDDVVTGQLRMIKEKNGELITEWNALQWKDDTRQREDDRCQNHLSDATLYAWRECRHFMFDPGEPLKDRDSQEYMDDIEKAEAKEMEAEEEREWWEARKEKENNVTFQGDVIYGRFGDKGREGLHSILQRKQNTSGQARAA